MFSWIQLSVGKVDKQMDPVLMFGRIEKNVLKTNRWRSSKKLDGNQQLRIKPANTTLCVAFSLLPATATDQR